MIKQYNFMNISKKNIILNSMAQNWQLVLILFVSVLVYSVNLFRYPAFREDEGTYMSQANAVLSGQLAPYTYWYDHAPVGWIMIAGWKLLTGNNFDFGSSIHSGRIFTVLINLISVIILYSISSTITKSKWSAFFTCLIMLASPFSVDFQRRVLLDNLMVFWLLLSIWFSLRVDKLYMVAASALTFALAFLTKESSIIFLPAILYTIFTNSHKFTRVVTTTLWFVLSMSIISLYPVFALIRGEFFPYGSILGGKNPHVSLLDAVFFQTKRSGGFFLDPTSSFQKVLNDSWLSGDTLLILFGIFALVINLVFFGRKRWVTYTSLLSLLYIGYLIRGQVLDWYIIPLIPLFALNIGIFISNLTSIFPHYRIRSTIKVSLSILLIVISFLQITTNSANFYYNQTENQRLAVDWLSNKMSADAVTLIDNYGFSDLNLNVKSVGDIRFHYYSKADSDPKVRFELIQDDWRNIDYVMYTPAVKQTLAAENMPLTEDAYNNARIVKSFNEYAVDGDPEANYPVEIREVNNYNHRMQKLWESTKDKLSHVNHDYKSQPLVELEQKSISLFQSVWMNDKEYFIQTYNDIRSKFNSNDDGQFELSDFPEKNQEYYTTIIRSKQHIAASLIRAYRTWGEEKYKTNAKAILDKLWQTYFKKTSIGYLLVTPSQLNMNNYLIDFGSLFPAYYNLFAEFDPSHEWQQANENVYRLIEKTSSSDAFKNSYNLVPNWIIVNEDLIYSAKDTVGLEGDLIGNQSAKLLTQIANDSLWFNSENAQKILISITEFWEKEWNRNFNFYSKYTIKGERVSDSKEDISLKTAAVHVLSATDSSESLDVYLSVVRNSFNPWSQWKTDDINQMQLYWNSLAQYADQSPIK